MKTKIFLVRHTETVGNIERRLTGRKDYDLTENGIILINKLTKKLSNVKFDKVYSSPSGRAIKTVEPLAKLNSLNVEINDDLAEMYFGIYDGWKWDDVNKINPRIKEQQNEINEIYGIPEQETMLHVADRMYNAIIKILDLNMGKNILIGSHGVAIEAFLRKIYKLPFRYEREKFCQYNVAINELDYDDGKFEILQLANIKYLEEV